LFVRTFSPAFFVMRTKSNVLLQRRYSHPVDKTSGVRSDQTVILSSFESASVYPDALRRVSYFDAETGKRLKFLTNNFTLPALTVAQIYKCRWQVELFFKVNFHHRPRQFQDHAYQSPQLCPGHGLSVVVIRETYPVCNGKRRSVESYPATGASL
jgi:Transposase DDE domain